MGKLKEFWEKNSVVGRIFGIIINAVMVAINLYTGKLSY